MATQVQATKAPSAPKVAKAPIATVQRVTEQMKRAALQGKISNEDLDAISNLAGALKTFMSA
ncbi:hypothetical protein [Variovorax sp. LG9.2]|uniref:hypothetical protein n=1 Tax=Variovorax sp. LG9.2 TaxID=3048626 RepID=UPI002B235E8A|nr:hypothetical protein [Variovorax sp. LG9.2]MEB0056725.1 hypothetical protein [Variovorax sp. LG9.2]